MDFNVESVRAVERAQRSELKSEVQTGNKPVLFKYQVSPPADSLLTKSFWSDETKGIVLNTTSKIGIKDWSPTLLKTNHDALKAAQNHLIDLMKYYEGDKYHYYEAFTYPYQDSYGNYTSGFGEWVKKNFTQETAYESMCAQLESRAKEIKNNLGKIYDELPQSIKEALIDLNYNKGLPKITGNKKLMKALKKGDYSEVVAELKYVHSGKSKAVKKKETEDPGLYRRSLNRMILACRDLTGQELDDAQKEIKKVYQEALKCHERNKKDTTELTQIYEQFTLGEIQTGAEVSAESFKFKIDDSFKGKGFFAVGQKLKEELKITDESDFKKFYAELLKANHNGKHFKLDTEINVPYLGNITGKPNDTNTSPVTQPSYEDTLKQDTAKYQMDTIVLDEVVVTEKEKVTKKPNFFQRMWNGVKSFFGGVFGGKPEKEKAPTTEDQVDNRPPFQRILEHPTKKVVTDGDFKIITIEHVVKKGDGVWRLAQTYNLDEKEFCQDNGIKDRDKIQIGQKLSMTKLAYEIQKGDNLFRISQKFGVDLEFISDLNGIEDNTKIEVGQMLELPGFMYTSKPGDTFTNLAERMGVAVNKLQELNNLNTDKIPAGTELKIVYNNAFYDKPANKKEVSVDKATNTVQTTVDMSDIEGTRNRPLLQKATTEKGRVVATRKKFTPTSTGNLNGYTIILNAGHGYKSNGKPDIGTEGRGGIPHEWLINHDNAIKLKDELCERGATVIFLQGQKALIDRAMKKAENKGDLFLSIHVNANKEGDIDRGQVIYRTKGIKNKANIEESKTFGEIAEKNLDAWIKANDNPDNPDERFYEPGSKNKKQDFTQLKMQNERTSVLCNPQNKFNMPSVLWEVGFMTSPKGRDRLGDEDLMRDYTRVMAESIEKFLRERKPKKA
ncbi:LysM peptidoglycan-binding domain-containing protein [bacterium]|nr:LysM peptidoglycan-binding domain-containing protein [bacterium]